MSNNNITKDSDKLNIAIGAKIRAKRIKMGFSIDMLASMVDLSSPFIGLIERGSRGTQLVNLVKICDILDLSLDEIVKKNNSTDFSFNEEDEFVDEAELKRTKIQKLLANLDVHSLAMIENLAEGLLTRPQSNEKSVKEVLTFINK